MQQKNGDFRDSYTVKVLGKIYASLERLLEKKLRSIVELVVLSATTWWALNLFGSAGAMRDYVIEAVLAVPAAALLMLMVHVLWSWATAPRQIYYEQLETINKLGARLGRTDALRPQLEIIFDKRSMVVDEVTQYKEGPRNRRDVHFTIRNIGEDRARGIRARVTTEETRGSRSNVDANTMRLVEHPLRRRIDTRDRHSDKFDLDPGESDVMLLCIVSSDHPTVMLSAPFSIFGGGCHGGGLDIKQLRVTVTAENAEAVTMYFQFKKSRKYGFNVDSVSCATSQPS